MSSAEHDRWIDYIEFSVPRKRAGRVVRQGKT